MLVGRRDLAPQRGVFRVLNAVENAFGVSLLRFVPEQQHGLAGHGHIGIIVISFRLGSNAIADEHQRQIELARAAIDRGGEIAVDRQRVPDWRLSRMFGRADQREAVVGAHGYGRGDLERLEGRSPKQVGSQAGLGKLVGDEVGRHVQSLAPKAAAFELIGSQVLGRFRQTSLDGRLIVGRTLGMSV